MGLPLIYVQLIYVDLKCRSVFLRTWRISVASKFTQTKSSVNHNFRFPKKSNCLWISYIAIKAEYFFFFINDYIFVAEDVIFAI